MKSQVPDYVQLLFSLVQYIRKAIDNSPATMDVKKMATALLDDLLPDRSKPRYEKASKEFQEWMASENILEITEEVILVYLSEKSKTIAPTGLQSLFCMLKATHKIGFFFGCESVYEEESGWIPPQKIKNIWN